MNCKKSLRLTWLLVGICAGFSGQPAAGQLDHQREPILYSQTESYDRVATLRDRINRRDIQLQWTEQTGYLTSVLRELNVPESSQVLVFSKTSLQSEKISPNHPRAVYFSDEVYVGFVDGGEVIELAIADAELGCVFYTLRQTSPTQIARDAYRWRGQAFAPRLQREDSRCLQCHAATHTGRVPGLIVRSVHCDQDGNPQLNQQMFITIDSSPMEQRWGGWFVSGSSGTQKHMGSPLDMNTVRDLTASDPPTIRPNLISYLRTTSDIVSLLLLEHQVTVQNAITTAGIAGRRAEFEHRSIQQALGESEYPLSEAIQRRLDHAAEKVVEALLLKDAVRFSHPVEPSNHFYREFQQAGPFDKQGRSLRELDLSTRLLRYPCSYLIYSAQFRGLPESIKSRIYRRIEQILRNQNDAGFRHLSGPDRKALSEILADTGIDLD